MIGRGQALLRVTPVCHDMLVDELFQQTVPRRRQRPLVDQNPSQRPMLSQHPRVHRRDQCVAGDEVHLYCQDPEQQITIG